MLVPESSWLFWAIFGPLRARFRPGRAEAHRGREAGVPGPKYGCLGYQDPSGGLRNPSGKFRLWGHSRSYCCCLLARRAGSTHGPNNQIRQQLLRNFSSMIFSQVKGLAQKPSPAQKTRRNYRTIHGVASHQGAPMAQSVVH